MCAYGVPSDAEELPLGLNASKEQIKPEVFVRELLHLSKASQEIFTVRHERLAGLLLVHYGLAQFPNTKWTRLTLSSC